MKKNFFLAAIFFIVAVEIAVGVVTYHFAQSSEQESLFLRTQTVAGAFDVREIAQLRGEMSDEATPAYQSLKQRLVRIGKVNPDVVSVYITGYRSGEVFFYADSVESGEVGEATPGLVYDEASPEFVSVMTEGMTIFEGPLADRWGTWVSAIAPIFDSTTGAVVASIGMDINASAYQIGVATKTLVPVLLLGVALLIFLIGYVRYVKNKELLMLKARFVSIASHELRSPVASIVWATESLLKSPAGEISQASSATIGLISQTGHQILETITEILDLPQLQGDKAGVRMETVNMLGVILEITKSMTLVAREHQITLQPDSSLPDRFEIVCDRAKTKRVISNVITNAIKYSPKGGVITLGYRRENGFHGVTVADQGIGIPQAEQGGIFKAEFRASNTASSGVAGSGFGLHLVKELMDAQGGTISFESRPGTGTTFFIAFKERQ